MRLLHPGSVLSASSLLLLSVTRSSASSCDPVTEDGCSADTALGTSVSIDFTSGASSQFNASGTPVYGSSGAEFIITESGDSPTIISNWYIMFGHVEYVIKAANGTGIVSSAVLQSDCLDEIDWEWIGGNDDEAQSNYFGKGITTTYNRGAWHDVSDNHDEFHTYTVDWTAEQIIWGIDGETVRVLTEADAESGQYPQTPMQVKIGIWAGGDSNNSAGTIEWAGGETDYDDGPFIMYLKSVSVQDYSTGTSYSYSNQNGTWESIVSDGGEVDSSSTGIDTPTTSLGTAAASSATSTSTSTDSSSATRTGWPWVTTTSTSATTTSTSSSGLSLSSSGSDSTSAGTRPAYLASSSASASSQVSSLASGLDISATSDDSQGFTTLVTVTAGAAASTQTESYDSQGSLISSTSSVSTLTTATSGAGTTTTTVVTVEPSSTTTTTTTSQTAEATSEAALSAGGARERPIWTLVLIAMGAVLLA